MIDLFLLAILAAFFYTRLYVLPRLEKLREEYENRKD